MLISFLDCILSAMILFATLVMFYCNVENFHLHSHFSFVVGLQILLELNVLSKSETQATDEADGTRKKVSVVNDSVHVVLFYIIRVPEELLLSDKQ